MRLARSISPLWYTPLGRLFNEYYKVGWRAFSLRMSTMTSSNRGVFGSGGRPVSAGRKQRFNQNEASILAASCAVSGI
jgi:hypothetical protein